MKKRDKLRLSMGCVHSFFFLLRSLPYFDEKKVLLYFSIFHSGTLHFGQGATISLFRSHLAALELRELRAWIVSPQWVVITT
jgi:hypothetical protein